MKYALLLAALCACSGPLKQYDHGRAYTEAFDTQSDLDRESAQDDAYPLSGEEGIELRARASEASTDAEETLTVEESED